MNQQNSNPFGDISTEGLEAARDVLGGGGIFDTGIYEGKIKYAFAGKTDSGSKFLALHFETEDGRVYRETMYVTNKQGQNFWTDKDKKKNPLPGFTTANDLSLLSTGYELNTQNFEEKVIPLYNFDSKQEVPTKVMMAVDMIDKPITLAINRVLENKQVKNETTGQYEPTDQTREKNEIAKVFHNKTGKTLSEYASEKDAEYGTKWLEKNKGKVVNKVKDVGGKTGAPGAVGRAAAAPAGNTGGGKPKSLFGG